MFKSAVSSLAFLTLTWAAPISAQVRFASSSDLGTVVSCSSGETHLLSVVEATINGQALATFDGSDYRGKFANFVSTQVAPYNAHAAAHLLEYIAHPEVKFLSGYLFPLLNTEKVLIPEGCDHLQLAIAGDGRNYVDKEIFDKLPINEQAMFFAQIAMQMKRDLVRRLFSNKPHLLSTYILLNMLGEKTMALSGDFIVSVQDQNPSTGSVTATSASGEMLTNFGKLSIPTTPMLLQEQGVFSVQILNQQPVKIQNQSAFIYNNNQWQTIYFHPTGEVCGAVIQINPPTIPPLKLRLISGEEVVIDSWGYVGFDERGRVLEIPGTVTPVRDQNEIARYCQSRFEAQKLRTRRDETFN